MQAIENVVDAFLEPDTPQYKKMHWQHVFHQQNLFVLQNQQSFPYLDTLNLQTIIDRNLSKSFIAALPKAKQAQIKKKIKEILSNDKKIDNLQCIKAPYQTDIFCYGKKTI